jgi:hypothetical protein
MQFSADGEKVGTATMVNSRVDPALFVGKSVQIEQRAGEGWYNNKRIHTHSQSEIEYILY